MPATKSKKVVMLGAFGVGKTSLVRRFVDHVFEADYESTIGTEIKKKSVEVDGETWELVIWDLAGEDEFSRPNDFYLDNAHGLLFVADRTRPWTLDTALEIRSRTSLRTPDAELSLLLNKTDLDCASDFEAQRASLPSDEWRVRETSARTGDGVEAAFRELAEAMLR